MELYEYAIIFTGDDDYKGAVIVAVDQLLAWSEVDARMKIARLIPDDYEDQLDDIDIVVRRWAVL